MVETRLILITRSDGGVSVMTFVVHSPRDGFRTEPTPENIEATIAKGRLDSVSWRFIAPADLPGRAYRDAWVDTGAGIGHDMEKARDIHRGKLRAARVPLLEALDVAYQRADEAGDIAEKARVVAAKNRLRDLPADPRIEQAVSVEELGALLGDPAALGAR